MTQVVLGVDPQPTRLGLALVALEPPHRPLWAATVRIDRPDGGWQHEQVTEAIRDVPIGRWGGIDPPHEVVRVGIEQPALIGSRVGTFRAGGAFALACAAAHRRWPWAPQVVRHPAEWKHDAIGRGNASKEDVMAWARGRGALEVWLERQDAADAMGIAVSAAMVELVGAE